MTLHFPYPFYSVLRKCYETCPFLLMECRHVVIRFYENENTVFVSCLEDSTETCSYIIGFPYAIGKYMLYYNGERFTRLLPVVKKIVLSALFI